MRDVLDNTMNHVLEKKTRNSLTSSFTTILSNRNQFHARFMRNINQILPCLVGSWLPVLLSVYWAFRIRFTLHNFK